MRLAYASAQPTLSRAREQAKKNNYPFFTLVTTTPNGSVGHGEWFFNMWNNAIDSEEIFDKDGNKKEDVDHIVNDKTKNGFVKVRFHWSEDPSKDENWYNEQCRDFNFDERMINQELDLVFAGATNCIFTDKFLGDLSPTTPNQKLKLPHQTYLNMYDRIQSLDKSDFLLIGADTAKSITGDFSAVEIFSYANFLQVGEYYDKLGSLTKYSEVLMKIVDILEPYVDNRIILCIENNSMGAAVIEDLENCQQKDYLKYIYSPDVEKYGYGINTNTKSKPILISVLYEYLNNNPKCIRSKMFSSQLNIIEKHANGAIRAKSGYHDDLFMAGGLCAYVRRISALEYEPLLGVSSLESQRRHSEQIVNSVKSSFVTDIPKNSISMKYNKQEGGVEYIIDDEYDEPLTDYDGVEQVFSIL